LKMRYGLNIFLLAEMVSASMTRLVSLFYDLAWIILDPNVSSVLFYRKKRVISTRYVLNYLSRHCFSRFWKTMITFDWVSVSKHLIHQNNQTKVSFLQCLICLDLKCLVFKIFLVVVSGGTYTPVVLITHFLR
jgi:hypothetical protein